MKTYLLAFFISLSVSPVFADKHSDERQIDCLALNIYFEAGNQSSLGKYAVAHVTINRVLSARFPDTICDVVWHKKWGSTSRRWVSQFSWTLDGKTDKPYTYPTKQNKTWEESKIIAMVVSKHHLALEDPTFNATHYHADYVHPQWARYLHKTIKIDKHIFYR